MDNIMVIAGLGYIIYMINNNNSQPKKNNIQAVEPPTDADVGPDSGWFASDAIYNPIIPHKTPISEDVDMQPDGTYNNIIDTIITQPTISNNNTINTESYGYIVPNPDNIKDELSKISEYQRVSKYNAKITANIPVSDNQHIFIGHSYKNFKISTGYVVLPLNYEINYYEAPTSLSSNDRSKIILETINIIAARTNDRDGTFYPKWF